MLARDGRNFELRHRQNWPLIGLGWAAYKQNNFNGAATYLNEALVNLDRLAVEYPDDRQVSLSQVRTGVMLAMTFRDSGNPKWADARQKAGAVAKRAARSGEDAGSERIKEMLAKFDRETGK
ncbi:MAG TPA: hypothetical protein VGN36_00320 [Sphingorhabdus sp.]|nr:hypothetical protein [Sphingorhabdus sp.]